MHRSGQKFHAIPPMSLSMTRDIEEKKEDSPERKSHMSTKKTIMRPKYISVN
jgi:hypothetical protein